MPQRERQLVTETTGDSGETLALVRIPHLDVDAALPLRPAKRFTFDVWCDDQAPAEGETVTPVTIEAPPERRTFLLDVWIAASAHFAVDDATGSLLLDRDVARSEALRFKARVVDDPPPGTGMIAAIFNHAGRSSGQVTRALPIAPAVADADAAAALSPSAEPAANRTPGGPPRIVVRSGQIVPDLTVEIRSLDPDGRTFACRVCTPGAPAVASVRWDLPRSLPAMVASYMEDFTSLGLGDHERRSKLIGAGLALWDEAPAAFTSVFWELAPSLTSILIQTDEWSFPWELLVPYRGHGRARQQLEPLGVAYQVGRWVTNDAIAPQQDVPLVDSYALAPWYAEPYTLASANAEAQYVIANFAGTLIDPADFDTIEKCFGGGGVSLVHFVCHGTAPVGKSQAVLLQGGGRLAAHQLAGMQALTEATRATEPLVFLNACEAGRGEPIIIGPGGFATAFIDLGARGVVAPVWSVEDSVAHDFATAFYDALLAAPDTPLGEVVRVLRARAYRPGGADTWAAYCLYGDPLARVRLAA